MAVLEAIEQRLSSEHAAWLAALPEEARVAELLLAEQLHAAPGKLEMTWTPWGSLATLSSHRMMLPIVGHGPDSTAEDAARGILGELGPALGVAQPDPSLVLRRVDVDGHGRTAIFNQEIDGVAVHGSRAVIALDLANRVRYVRTALLPDIARPATLDPLISSEDALSAVALTHPLVTDEPVPLAIWSPALFGERATEAYLA